MLSTKQGMSLLNKYFIEFNTILTFYTRVTQYLPLLRPIKSLLFVQERGDSRNSLNFCHQRELIQRCQFIKFYFWQMGSLLALVKCLINWKINLRRWKASIFSANNKIQSIVLNIGDFIIIFTFIIYNRSDSSVMSQEKIIQRTINLHNAMQLSYFTSENTRYYDKILHIYTCWHSGLTAAFSKKHTEICSP